MRRSICILSLSPIYRDARVLRQITYLVPHYDLIVIGFGHPHPAWEHDDRVKWVTLDKPKPLVREDTELVAAIRRNTPEFIKKIIRTYYKIKIPTEYYLKGLIVRVFPTLYERWYWRTYGRYYPVVEANPCDAIHANDWDTLPLAVEAAKKTGARVVSDLHEYAPLQREHDWLWKWLDTGKITHMLKKYTPFIASSITVGPTIAERYKQEFGLDPTVVLNVPEYHEASTATPPADEQPIRLIHHGGAARARKLELMIETVALCDRRFELHLMLVKNSDDTYIDELQQLAEEKAPGRVFFHDPVPTERIIETISQYDMGFSLIFPSNYNNLMSLPNKFFDYIIAGLALCVGPSPDMAAMVKAHGCGCVASSFEPQDIADTLNKLTPSQIAEMQQAARAAAEKINAPNELKKVVQIYQHILPHTLVL